MPTAAKVPASDPADEPVPTLTMTVAAGRTIQLANNWVMKRQTLMIDGKQVEQYSRHHIAGKFTAVPGDKVTLPIDEATRLHALGYLRTSNEPETRPRDQNVQVEDPDAVSITREDLDA